MKFIIPNWPAPSHVKAYTTSKLGWGGRLAHHDANRGHIDLSNPHYQNESKALKQLLNLPSEPIWITQTHSTKIIEALPQHRETEADASYSHQTGEICVVLTADCLPILITNRSGRTVAAIHAGWRGLVNGILEQTLDALNIPSQDIFVWLGPAISVHKFEVGSEVYDLFLKYFPHAKLGFKRHHNNDDKWFANLYLLARLQLAQRGVRHIYGGGFCTYLQDNLFFSYRRDNGKTGRMASLIWITCN